MKTILLILIMILVFPLAVSAVEPHPAAPATEIYKRCNSLRIEIESLMNERDLSTSYQHLMEAIRDEMRANNLIQIYNAMGCDPMVLDIKPYER